MALLPSLTVFPAHVQSCLGQVEGAPKITGKDVWDRCLKDCTDLREVLGWGGSDRGRDRWRSSRTCQVTPASVSQGASIVELHLAEDLQDVALGLV